jgi:hypothetical protein
MPIADTELLRVLATYCRSCRLLILAPLLFAVTAVAQESPAPTPSPTAGESPSVSPIPEESPSVSPTPEESPSPSAAPSRSVRISFLPPPLEGTISLGIYDGNGTLVRVLHQQAELNKFTIGTDALLTQWDGKNDQGEDLPPGKYHARGYLVGALRAEPMSNSSPPGDVMVPTNVQVKLIPNPLAKDRRQTVELGARLDQEKTFLGTADGLPLFTIDEKPGLTRVVMKKSGQNSVDIWEEGSGQAVQFRVSNLDQMMAFDCGEFELK